MSTKFDAFTQQLETLRKHRDATVITTLKYAQQPEIYL